MGANTKQGKTLLNMRSAHLPSPEGALKIAHTEAQSPNLSEDQVSVIEANPDMSSVQLLQSATDQKQLVLDQASVTDDIQIMELEDIPQDMQSAGINPIRPELIAALEFVPGGIQTTTWEGIFKILDLRYCTREVQRDNVRRFILAVKEEAKDEYQAQVEKYTEERKKANRHIYILQKILDTQNAATAALDLKLTLHNNLEFDTYVREMFINVMGFSEAGFDAFSNSKIMCQIVEDLYFMGENYSPSLIGSPPSSRANDIEPFLINKIHKTKSFTFTRRTLRPRTPNHEPPDWYSLEDYRYKYVESLPKTWDNRVKILVSSYSRELIISAQVGAFRYAKDVGKESDVPAFFSSGRPFLYALGTVGKSALSRKGPPGALSTKLMINRAKDKVVPFEPRGVTSPQKSNYTPGGEAFILGPIAKAAQEGAGSFDLSDFVEWADDFYNLTSDVSDYCARLMGLYVEGKNQHREALNTGASAFKGLNESAMAFSITDNFRGAESKNSPTAAANKIRAPRLYARMLEIIETVASHMEDYAAVNEQQGLCVAILKLADGDVTLRYFVYQWLLEFSLNYDTTGKNNKAMEFTRPDPVKLRDMEDMIISRVEKKAPSYNPVDGASRQGAKRNIVRWSLNAASIKSRLGWLPAFDDADTNIFVLLIKYIYELYAEADGLADELESTAKALKWASSKSGRQTNATSLSFEALLAMVLEMFVPLISRCLSSDLSREGSSKTTGGKQSSKSSGNAVDFEVAVDTGKNTTIIAVIKDIFERPGPGTGGYATDDLSMGRVSEKKWARDVWEELQAIYYSFQVETQDFFTLLTSLQYFAANIQTAAKQLNSAFSIPINPEDRSLKQKELAWLVSGNTLPQSIMQSLSNEQIALARAAKSVYRRRAANDKSWLPARSWIYIRERELIKSMLNIPSLNGKKAENVRVLTVGLPRGLTKYLVNPLYSMGSGASSATLRENRLVEISIYRRDFEYEDVIFKPKTFLFDPFLFITNWDGMNGVPWKQYMSFMDKALQKIKYARMQVNAGTPALTAIEHMEAGAYSDYNLKGFEGTAMFWNHALSYTLTIYYKLLFGLEIDEFGFFSNEMYNESIIDNSAAPILDLAATKSALKEKLPLGDVPWKHALTEALRPQGWRVKQLNEFASRLLPTIRDLSTDGATVPEELPPDISMEEALHFRAVGSSTLLTAGSIAEKIIAPRLFDRVFMIPVDPDDFSIDKDATWNNGSDAQALMKSDEWQNMTETIGGELRIRPRRMNDGKYEFSDFFAQVALKEISAGG
jgi:hypothetical protein